MRSNDPKVYGGVHACDGLPRTEAMDRRSFLQCTAGGMLLSVLAGRTAAGTSVQDVTLSSDGFALALRVPEGDQVLVRSLANVKTRFEWCQPDTPFEPVLVASGSPRSGWRTQRQEWASGRSRFVFTAKHSSDMVDARHLLQSVADAPFVELHAEFQAAGAQPLEAVTALGPMRFRLRDALGEVKLWPAGSGLSVLEAVGTGEFLILGMEFGSAVCRLERHGNERWVNVEVSGVISVPGATVAPFARDIPPGGRLQAPRVFVGAFHGDLEGALLAAQHYLQRHVFPKPVKDWPWVEYGIWATEPQGVEEALYKEVDFAADLGFEVITHDAGWYTGSSKDGTGNWGAGLGHYTDDRDKFPHGLAALSRHVHGKGMKFGLWVGPNVVDPRVVGSVIPERWLCLMDGQRQVQPAFGPANAPVMVCLGCREYLDYVKKSVIGIVKGYDVDLLRWDDSGMNGGCNRTDHGHAAGDWGYAWQTARYEIWAELHAKFPNLVIEACSAVDAGALRSVRMFGGIWGPPGLQLGPSALPTPYVDCFLEAGLNDDGSIRGSSSPTAMDTLYRRFMLSKWCVGTIQGKLSGRFSLRPEPLLAAARRNIPLYKRLRHLLHCDRYHLLPAAGTAVEEVWGAPDGRWIVHQFVSRSRDEAVVFAFRNNSSQTDVRVPLRALRAERAYRVTSANTDRRTTMRGADLLESGLALSLGDADMSEVVLLKA